MTEYKIKTFLEIEKNIYCGVMCADDLAIGRYTSRISIEDFAKHTKVIIGSEQIGLVNEFPDLKDQFGDYFNSSDKFAPLPNDTFTTLKTLLGR
jgi:hypothetical protein